MFALVLNFVSHFPKDFCGMRLFYIFSICIFTIFSNIIFAKAQNDEFTSIPIEIDADFLYLPISIDATYRHVKILDENDVEIFSEPVMLTMGKGQWYAPIDVSAHKGRKLSVLFEKKDFIGEPIILTSDASFSRDYSRDTGRPSYHISATNGILGSSSGLFFYDGKYYAFILQNPKIFSLMGRFQLALWTSDDLVNWKAVNSPSFLKNKITSPASVYVDNDNLCGLFPTKNKGVLFASSNERNETFLAYAEQVENIKYVNDAKPILAGKGKWPFIFFNKNSKLWTIVRTETDGNGKNFVAIYVSEDLVEWELSDKVLNDIVDTNVNFAQVDVLGSDEEKKWVFILGNGSYVVGDFDGRKFKQISKEPLWIFGGAVSYVQTWNNMPNSQLLASATLIQPLPIILHVKQHFINVMSVPWKLSLVKVIGGQYQLRADVSEQMMEHIGFHKDASGGTMVFQSNTFTVPDAYGNYCMYSGTFEVDKTLSVTLEVGVGVFGYNLNSGKYFMRRLLKDVGQWNAPLKRDLKIIPFKALVDSYSTEVVWFSGDMVMMMADAFLNPEQTIKVGAVGVTRVEKLDMFPIFKNKIRDLREATIKIFRKPPESSKDAKQK